MVAFDRETVVLIETLDVYAGGLDAEIKSHLRAMEDLSIESHPDPISLVRLGESARTLAGLADTLVTILGVKFNLDGTEGDDEPPMPEGDDEPPMPDPTWTH